MKAIHGDIAKKMDYRGEIGREGGGSLGGDLGWGLLGVMYIHLGKFWNEMIAEMALKQ